MDTGSTRKYLLYAIGEVLLVMIGILLALQVNNWNEVRKGRQVEINTLIELRDGIVDNIEQLQTRSENSARDVQAIKYLIQHLKEKRPYVDSLEELFYYPYRGNAPFVSSAGMRLLDSRGVDIISNTELRREIVRYFEYNLEVMHRMAQSEETRLDAFRIEYQKKLGQRTDEMYLGHTGRYYPKTYPYDYEALLEDVEFQRGLLWRATRRLTLIDRIKTSVLIPSEKLVEHINEELDRLNG